MLRNSTRTIFLLSGMTALSLFFLAACGGFGGRYKIATKPMDEFSTNKKIPIDVKLVLDPELCNYVYVSRRQGAKRVYELGDALCSNTQNLFTTLFKDVTVVKNKDDNNESNIDAIVIPKVVDTSVLVRPGAPPNFDAAIIYECSMEDVSGRTIFVRTVKENKVLKQYGYDSYRIVMQEAVNELFTQLGNEVVYSPEIKKFANSLK